MDSNPSNRIVQTDPMMVSAIKGCLQLLMDDINAQYRHVCYETNRLNRAGNSVNHIIQQLDLQVNPKTGEYRPRLQK